MAYYYIVFLPFIIFNILYRYIYLLVSQEVVLFKNKTSYFILLLGFIALVETELVK